MKRTNRINWRQIVCNVNVLYPIDWLPQSPYDPRTRFHRAPFATVFPWDAIRMMSTFSSFDSHLDDSACLITNFASMDAAANTLSNCWIHLWRAAAFPTSMKQPYMQLMSAGCMSSCCTSLRTSSAFPFLSFSSFFVCSCERR